MKKFVLAGVLAGVSPAFVFGQQTCPEERCQVAPYFAGGGGFVGTSAGLEGEDDVTFFVICTGRTVRSTVSPDSAGIVRQTLSSSNGLSCPGGARGRLEIENLEPGGWYWINDDRNSAVAALIPKEAVGNEQIRITDPGGLTLDAEEDGIGTFVKHAATGRVGIIPHLVPVPALRGCSGPAGGESARNCHLGSALGWRLTASSSTVTRPTGSQRERTVTVTLHGENFITVRPLSARAELDYGFGVEAIRLGQDGGARVNEGEPGLLQWGVVVGTDDARCLPENESPDRLKPQEITFSIAAMDGAIPALTEDGLETTIEVNCPSGSAASAGAELVPENPFPVDG